VKAKDLTEGAISLAIYIIILLMFLYLPLFGGLFTFVLPFPFLYYTAKYNWKAGLLFFTASIILTLIVGSWIALPVPFLYGFVGFVLGWNIYHQREALITFSTSTLALLFSVVVVYIISAILFDMNFIKEAQTMFKEVMDQTISMVDYMGGNTDQIKEQLTEAYGLIISLLPCFDYPTYFLSDFKKVWNSSESSKTIQGNHITEKFNMVFFNNYFICIYN